MSTNLQLTESSVDRILTLSYLNGGEVGVRLFAQLFNAAPCPKCDYIKKHCKCRNTLPAVDAGSGDAAQPAPKDGSP